MPKPELVTVAVTAFNSAKTIEDTLESVKRQSYHLLELIISDDASSDNSVELATNWLNKPGNSKRFAGSRIITVPKNTGVSANCNRCIETAQSDWIKFIAGDDILLPNCIEDNMLFADNNPTARIIFSQVEVFVDNFEKENFLRIIPAQFPDNLMHPQFSANDQWKRLLVSDRMHYTPSYFFNRKALDQVGNYDESNRLVEDYPMWLKLTAAGERLYYFHKATVGYRMHAKALNNTGDAGLFKPLSVKAFAIRRQLAHPHLPADIVGKEKWEQGVKKFFLVIGANKNTAIARTLYRLLSVYLNPWQYVYAVKKRLPANKGNIFYQ
ncbi:MAG: glycosyltransferase [Imperialibacter sp.]|uniref:glycosyltransferase n=1 Tax=Imperialibacter sp. TaxID=2038411 RepID=UPI0032EC934F